MSFDFLDGSLSSYFRGKDDCREEQAEKLIKIIGKDSSSSEAPIYERIWESLPQDLGEHKTSYDQLLSYADEMMYKIKAIRDSFNLENDTY